MNNMDGMIKIKYADGSYNREFIGTPDDCMRMMKLQYLKNRNYVPNADIDKILILPCLAGEKCYVVDENGDIEKCIVEEISIFKDGKYIWVDRESQYDKHEFSFNEIGKELFVGKDAHDDALSEKRRLRKFKEVDDN